jgi:hypothetical protein
LLFLWFEYHKVILLVTSNCEKLVFKNNELSSLTLSTNSPFSGKELHEIRVDEDTADLSLLISDGIEIQILIDEASCAMAGACILL